MAHEGNPSGSFEFPEGEAEMSRRGGEEIPVVATYDIPRRTEAHAKIERQLATMGLYYS